MNLDQVNTAYHGLKMTPVALSKLGMLYLQKGMANGNDQIVDPSWIERSFTVGDADVEPGDLFGYLGWWLDGENCTYGFGGQRLCLNYETNRVLASKLLFVGELFACVGLCCAVLSISVSRVSTLTTTVAPLSSVHVIVMSDTYYKDAGIDAYQDPTAGYPTDQIKDKFCKTPATLPNACVAATSSNGPAVGDSSGGGQRKISLAFALAAGLASAVALMIAA